MYIIIAIMSRAFTIVKRSGVVIKVTRVRKSASSRNGIIKVGLAFSLFSLNGFYFYLLLKCSVLSNVSFFSFSF